MMQPKMDCNNCTQDGANNDPQLQLAGTIAMIAVLAVLGSVILGVLAYSIDCHPKLRCCRKQQPVEEMPHLQDQLPGHLIGGLGEGFPDIGLIMIEIPRIGMSSCSTVSIGPAQSDATLDA